MILYLSGKYSAGNREENIAVARDVALVCLDAGVIPLTPHLNFARFEEESALTYEQFLANDLALILRCDGVLLLPGWEDSPGALRERAYAEMHGIPVYNYQIDGVPFPVDTEQRCPQQCEAFLSTVMNMYRVHLRKNADYSPANILGTGEIGLTTRVWDKMARIMHLTGFQLDLRGSRFDHSRTPKNESLTDSWMDMAVYAVIWLIHATGKWGK